APSLYHAFFKENAVLTPNLAEAGAIAERPAPEDEAGMRACASRFLEAGAGAVLVKGGHLEGEAVDLLVRAEEALRLGPPRLPRGRRGTGCRMASFLAGRLAAGDELGEAFRKAKAALHHYVAEGKLPAPRGAA